jgi:hypothetical protein
MFCLPRNVSHLFGNGVCTDMVLDDKLSGVFLALLVQIRT